MTLDRAGRVVLPENHRDELHLSPGDTLDVTVQGDEVKLRPRRNMPECVRFQFLPLPSAKTLRNSSLVLRRLRKCCWSGARS